MKTLIFVILVICFGCTSVDTHTKRAAELDSLMLEREKAWQELAISSYRSGWIGGYMSALLWNLDLQAGKIDETPSEEVREKAVDEYKALMGFK